MDDFTKQYLRYGGFCGECGEALEPVMKEDYEKFGLCPYNGKHPTRCIRNYERRRNIKKSNRESY